MKIIIHEKRLKSPRSQRGALLVVSILLLAVLTIVSLSSMTSTVLREKTTHNSFNQQLAFTASETSLRIAEEYIRQMNERPLAKSSCTTDCDIIWSANALGELYGGQYKDNWWTIANYTTDDTWWNTVTHKTPKILAPNGTTGPDNVAYTAAQPRFIAEEIAFIPDDLSPNTRATGVGLHFYRITSRGTGAESSRGGVNPAQIYVQSIFGKRFN